MVSAPPCSTNQHTARSQGRKDYRHYKVTKNGSSTVNASREKDLSRLYNLIKDQEKKKKNKTPDYQFIIALKGVPVWTDLFRSVVSCFLREYKRTTQQNTQLKVSLLSVSRKANMQQKVSV